MKMRVNKVGNFHEKTSHQKDDRLTGRKRQTASISLALCCLLPMVVLTYLGIMLDNHMPVITFVMVLLALPIIGILINVETLRKVFGR